MKNVLSILIFFLFLSVSNLLFFCKSIEKKNNKNEELNSFFYRDDINNTTEFNLQTKSLPIVMHATWEIRENARGGIGSVVSDIVGALNEGHDVEPMVIMPWFSFMNFPDKKLKLIKEIIHFYKKKIVRSAIYYLNLDNIHYFLFKPLGEYKDLLKMESKNNIYASSQNGYSLVDRMVYVSSGIASFVFNLKINGRFIDIFHCHDISLSLVNTIKKKYYQDFKKTKTIFHMHSFGSKQGVYLNYDHFGGLINLTKEAINNSDYIITVSKGMVDDALSNNIRANFGLQNEFEKAFSEGRLGSVLNGIDTSYWNGIESAKNIIEEKNSSKLVLKEKKLIRSLDNPIYTFIGRIAEVKGINLIQYAYEEIIKKNGYLLIVGKDEMDALSMSYIKSIEKKENVVVLLDESWKKYFSSYKEFDFHIRKSSDFSLFPSWSEPCGLVPMEMMRFGVIPITSKVMGMRDYLIDFNGLSEDMSYIGNSFNFDNGFYAGRPIEFAGNNFKQSIDLSYQFYRSSEKTKEKILERIYNESSRFDWGYENGSLSHLINIYKNLN